MLLIRGKYAKTLGLGPNSLRHLDEFMKMGNDPAHIVRTIIGAANGNKNLQFRLSRWEEMMGYLDDKNAPM